MEKLIVHDTDPAEQGVTLRDEEGRLHLARATSDMPVVGSALWGYPPSLGFTTLFGSNEGRVYRVIFEGVKSWPE